MRCPVFPFAALLGTTGDALLPGAPTLPEAATMVLREIRMPVALFRIFAASIRISKRF